MKQSFDVESEVSSSPCCECGHVLDRVSGPDQPVPGDFTLCIRCTSLNVFAENMLFRRPTDDEIFNAAASSEVQAVRRIILRSQKAAGR